ncbi:MAG: radical SAM protein [Actinomycetota bacterium]
MLLTQTRDTTAHRALVMSDRLRPFTWQGRQYAHTSAVPLSYLSISPTIWQLLQGFSSPTRLVDLMSTTSTADAAFIDELVVAGILLDADNPDPVHSARPRSDAVATFYLYPTSSCNLRCVYCYATSGPGSGPRLSPEHALMAVDGFFEQLGPQVEAVLLNFHGGGEPTTNFPVMEKAWQRFRELAAQRGLRASVSTITNGTFGPAVLRALSQPEWSLMISYDGPRQADQRPTAAGTDSRERVVANIRALREAGKRVSTRATLTRDGLPFLNQLVEDAAEVGIAAMQVEPASLVGRGANLEDGPPEAMEFAEAFLEAFTYGLRLGVQVTTAALSHGRVGDGKNCGAISGLTAVTPDGFISACVEATDGKDAEDPFIIGTLNTLTSQLETWPLREQKLQSRIGYDMPHCSTCYMVDTCGGGCASRARARHGSAFVRDEFNCVVSRHVNPAVMADLADGRLVADIGWQPREAALREDESSISGGSARIVELVPTYARRVWNADPRRRPILPVPLWPQFFHLPD